jgi:hypothetical protein
MYCYNEYIIGFRVLKSTPTFMPTNIRFVEIYSYLPIGLEKKSIIQCKYNLHVNNVDKKSIRDFFYGNAIGKLKIITRVKSRFLKYRSTRYLNFLRAFKRFFSYFIRELFDKILTLLQTNPRSQNQ